VANTKELKVSFVTYPKENRPDLLECKVEKWTWPQSSLDAAVLSGTSTHWDVLGSRQKPRRFDVLFWKDNERNG
jgi:hypothetical protein